ncbi:sulfotransferase family protein [Methyloferula stellata]|uniref:sulfotransferase family protein n=1 Tax=Methyloferula stellata TaxID=876270 RepID=UPI00035D5EB3|nr:sulfotransferase family protein [Methyloferula stellata]
MSDVIIVLGMHRSGTSAVAGTLTKLGGAAPKHLMPGSPTNPAGYFESRPIMELHDELLAAAGSIWHDWRKFNPLWYGSPVAAGYKERAKDLFQAEFDSAPLSVLKDPRICRFAPFWLDIFKEMDVNPRVVIPIRSPLEVAQSLKARDGMPLTKGLLLWLRHVLDAELESRNVARSIVTWNDFISDWRRISEKISNDTGLAWPRLSDRSAHDIEHFLKTELVHNRVDHAELSAHSDVHEWTIAAYEALLELAHNPFSNSAAEKLNEIRHVVEQSSAMFGRLLMDYEIGIEDLQTRIIAVQSERDLLHARQADAHAGLISLQQDRDRLSAELQARDEALGAAAARLAETEAGAALADIGRAQSEAARVQANDENIELKSRVESHTAQISALLAEKDQLAVTIDAQRREAAKTMALLASRSAQLEQGEAAFAADLERVRAEKQKLEAFHQTALAEAERNNAAVEAALAQMVTEKNRLASEHAGLSVELQRLQKASVTAAATAASARSELHDRYEGEIQVLRSQLVDTEARLAKHRNGRAWIKGLPLFAPTHRAEGRLQRSGLFDADWYRAEYKDAAESWLRPVRHYLEEGYLRGYRPNPFFDTRWYLDRYADVRHSGMNPLLHYMLHGWREGRDAGPDFHTNFYLLTHPDVRAAGMNPLAHYLRHGRAEGRAAVRPQEL